MMRRRNRPASRWKHDCPAAHGQDKCWYDTVSIRSSDPRWFPASDRRRLASANAEIQEVAA